MKKLIEEYGEAIVAIVVAVIMFFLIFSFAYPMVANSSKNITDKAGNSAWESKTSAILPTIASSSKPTIEAKSAYIDYGSRFNIKNYCTAYDENGTNLSSNISIYSITTTEVDEDGKTRDVTKKATKTSPITLDTTKPGTYIVKFQVFNRESVLSKYMVYSYATAKYVVSNTTKAPTETLDTEKFREYAKNVQPTKVVFGTSLANAPNDTFDVSVAQNDSILAWLDTTTEEGERILMVAQSGGVVASKNCNNLFYSGDIDGWQSNIKEIDLTYFLEGNITNAYRMFCNCTSLEKIYVYNDWDVSGIRTSTEMFENAVNLHGYQGTVYNHDNIDASMAHLDGSNGKPGYFSVFKIVVNKINGEVNYSGNPTSGNTRVEVLNPTKKAVVRYGVVQGVYNFSAVPTYTNVGTYKIYFQVTAPKYETLEGELTLTIKKADAVVVTPKPLDLTYDGTAQELVDGASTTGGALQYKVIDENGQESAWSDSIPTATNAGTYTVKTRVIADSNHNEVEIDDVTVEIKKAPINITTEAVGKNISYTGDPIELLETLPVSDNGTIMYSQDNQNWSTDVPRAVDAGDYTIYYYAKGNENYKDTSVKETVAQIYRAFIQYTTTDGVAAYTGEPLLTDAKVNVTYPKSGATIKYGTEEGVYDSDTMPKFTKIGVHQIYFEVSHPNCVSVTGVLNVTINPNVEGILAPEAKQGLVYNGKPQQLLEPGFSSHGKYYYSMDIVNWSEDVPSVTDAGEYQVFIKYVADGQDDTDIISGIMVNIDRAPLDLSLSSTSGSITFPQTSLTFTVNSSVDTEKFISVSDDGYVDASLDENDGKTVIVTWKKDTNNTREFGDTNITIKVDNNNYEQKELTFTVATKKGHFYSLNSSTGNKTTYDGTEKSAQALQVTAVNPDLNIDDTIENLSYVVKYGNKEGEYTRDTPPSYTKAGEYTVYYQVKGENFETVESSYKFTIAKASAKFKTEPKAVDGLIYTGDEIELVTAGTTDDGTVQYSLDGENWSNDIPKAIEVGDYEVYYRILGDENHENTIPVMISVSVISADSKLMTGPEFNVIIPESVTSVIFTTEKEPEGATLIDVSEKQNKGVVAWVDGTRFVVSSRVSNKCVDFNEDSSQMFANKTNLTEVKVGGAGYPEAETYSGYGMFNIENSNSMFFNCSGLVYTDLFVPQSKDVSWMYAWCSSLKSCLDNKPFFFYCSGENTKMEGLFAGCEKITGVIFFGMDENGLFEDEFGNLQDIKVQGSTYAMFYNCKSLSTIQSRLDTTNVTNMDSMFFGCESLLGLADFNGDLKLITKNVTNMNAMFYGCKSLDTDVLLSGFDTSKVETMSNMFAWCNSITSLDLSNFKTDKVTDMSRMFVGMESLTDLNISSFDTSNVTAMDYMFYCNKNLTELDLSNFDTSKMTNAENMFQFCEKLKRIYVDDTWTVNGVTKSDSMFDGCSEIIGQSGTTYDENKTDKSMANYQTGYLTYKSLPRTLIPGPDFNKQIPDTATSIVFTDEKAPSGTTLTDLTVAKKKGVVGWLDGTTWKVSTQKTGEKVELNEDSSEMFASNTKLTSISFNNVDTSKVVAMTTMFGSCTQLKTLVGLNTFDTRNVESMSYMFNSCTKLTNIDVSSFDTSKTKGMRYMFHYCSGLTSLDLSNFKTDKVESMSNMFSYCSKLTSLDVSSFNTSNVTDMSNMFYKCSSLTSLNVSNFDTSKVTDMNYMFYDCYELKTIYVSDIWNVDSVTSSSSMFNNCSVIVGQSEVTYDSNKTDKSMANYQTGYLTHIDAKYILKTGSEFHYLVPYNVATVKFTDEKAPNGASLTDVTVAQMGGVVAWLDGTTWKVSTQKAGEKVKFNKDSSKMFYLGSGFTSISFNNVDTSKVTNMNNMFFNCSSLTSLDVSNFDTSKVTNMGGMFSNCSSLTSLDVSNFDTSEVTSMGRMFSNCSGLTSLDVSNFDTSEVTAMGSMFDYCSSLTSLDVSSFDTSKVTNMTWMFSNCSGLTSLDVSNFDTSEVTAMGSMFGACSNLTSLDLSSFDISKVTYMSYMLYDCSKLKTIYVSDIWNVDNVTSSYGMLKNCSAIVGQSGVTYDSNKTDKSMASYQTGYLTYRSPGYIISEEIYRKSNSTTINGRKIIFMNDDENNSYNAFEMQLLANNAGAFYLNMTSTSEANKKISVKYIHQQDSGYYSIRMKANESILDSEVVYNNCYFENGKTYTISYQTGEISANKVEVYNVRVTPDDVLSPMVTKTYSLTDVDAPEYSTSYRKSVDI